MYTALSRVTNYDQLYCIGEFKMPSIKVNTSARDEYKRLQKKSIFENIEEVALSNNSLTILLLNVLIIF